MEEAEDSRYWCHMCSQVVNPVRETETVKCPFCQSGFVEEMPSATAPGNDSPPDFGLGGSDSDRALSLWAPILLGMMGNGRRRPSRRLEFEDDDRDEYNNIVRHHEGEMELDQLESLVRRRRRNSATFLDLLQGIRTGVLSDSMMSEIDQLNRETDNGRDNHGMVLINPFNQTIIVSGLHGVANDSQNRVPIGSLGDYFIGPGLDLLLQHLADNDPNRYGTPPAQKEAVEALLTVKNKEIMQCSVCLDDCEIGTEMKELPCRHKFHSGCILRWLDLHSSCPVCRYQLPSDESKLDSSMSRNTSDVSHENANNVSHSDGGIGGDDRNENWRRFSVPLPWPFNFFSSSSTSQTSSGNSSFTSPSMSSNPPHGTSREDGN